MLIKKRWILAPILALSLSLFANEEIADHFASIADSSYKNSNSKKKGKNQETCEPQYLSWRSWADFLYWQPIQENMEPAALYTALVPVGFVGSDEATIVKMDFDYKPAFAVGTAVIFDQTCDVSAEYTRFYSTQTTSAKGDVFSPMQLDPTTLLSFVNGISVVGGFGGAAPFSFRQKWNLEMDILDVEFGRYKCEKKFIQLHPFVGVRAAWIDQSLRTEYVANLLNGGAQVGTAEVHMRTNSWGVGIRGGLNTTCKLGAGFKFYGNGAGDLLYTQYDWRARANTVVNPLVNRSSDLSENDIPTLRFHLDAELGFLWGIDYKMGQCRQGRFEIGAGYGFQAFFDQNMFRHFTTTLEVIGLSGDGLPVLTGAAQTAVSNAPNGNLYIQGLRLHASCTY